MMLQRTTVDAIVLDMATPGLDGFAVHAETIPDARTRTVAIFGHLGSLPGRATGDRGTILTEQGASGVRPYKTPW